MLVRHTILVSFAVFLAALSLGSSRSWAHCDGLDGPVVMSARAALENGNVNQVLIWVRDKDESEIRTAFDETMAVRKLGPEAQSLADRYFFETLVRIHRAGEGAPFTGLKPAGRDLGPAIPAADEAIASESDTELVSLLTERMRHGLSARLEAVVERKDFSPNDVEAGRAYVKAYVPFIHYVERLYEAAAWSAEGHFESH